MKKIIAVFLAVLMAFSTLGVVAFAEDTAPAGDTTTTDEDVPRYPDDTGIPNIVNDDGLVYPQNPNQLEMSFVFKIVERIINFFKGLFGGDDLDMNLTESVSDFGKWLDGILGNIKGSLDL